MQKVIVKHRLHVCIQILLFSQGQCYALAQKIWHPIRPVTEGIKGV